MINADVGYDFYDINIINFAVTMVVALLVGFQLVALLFIGIFARTGSTSSLISTYNPLFSNCFLLILAFTLMYNPFRKFSLFSLGSILMVTAITIQTYFLFGTFWDSCFTGFSSTFTIDLTLITRSLYSTLLVLLTVMDFIGIFCYWQVYLIMAPIMTIGSSLSSAILIRGLKIFDGGGGLLLFFYSGICSLMIWLVLIRGNIDNNKLLFKKSYISQTLGLIGLILAFINWPKFNAAGAIVSYFNVNTTSISVGNLQGSAIGNTYLALSSSILLSFLFAPKENNSQDKMHYPVFIDCFVNAGISIASFQDVALDPTACIIIASFTTICTLLISKLYLSLGDSNTQSQFKLFMLSYGKIFYRLVIPFLGIIICSIVVGSRSSRSPALLSDNYSKIAGLEIVGFIIVLIFGVIFGAITAYCIKVFIASKEGAIQKTQKQNQIVAKLKEYFKTKKLQLQDQLYFEGLSEQVHPLYYDIIENSKEAKQQKNQLLKYSSRLKEALLGESSNPLRYLQAQKAVQTNSPEQPKKSTISNNFTKRNIRLDKPLQVSAMKESLKLQPQKKEAPTPVSKLELDSNQNDIANQIERNQIELSKESDRQSEGMVSFGNELLVSKSNITFRKENERYRQFPGEVEREESHVYINLTSSRAVEGNPDVVQ